MADDFILSVLLNRNAKWAHDVAASDPDFFPESANNPQTPKVLWIGCSDSRVPESVVTASRPGDIFVHRNIANQFHPTDDNAVSVLAYAVDAVRVEHIIVVGHTRCGGVEKCFNDAQSPSTPPANALERWLTPLTELARTINSEPENNLTIAMLMEANVRMQVKNLVESEVIKAAWNRGQDVYVHGWVYNLEDGMLRDMCISVGKSGDVQ